MNMAATSKPVWSVISWKQVGLVSLISVRQSPITSRPTCFQEITDQTGFDVAAMFITALEKNIEA